MAACFSQISLDAESQLCVMSVSYIQFKICSSGTHKCLLYFLVFTDNDCHSLHYRCINLLCVECFRMFHCFGFTTNNLTLHICLISSHIRQLFSANTALIIIVLYTICSAPNGRRTKLATSCRSK